MGNLTDLLSYPPGSIHVVPLEETGAEQVIAGVVPTKAYAVVGIFGTITATGTIQFFSDDADGVPTNLTGPIQLAESGGLAWTGPILFGTALGSALHITVSTGTFNGVIIYVETDTAFWTVGA